MRVFRVMSEEEFNCLMEKGCGYCFKRDWKGRAVKEKWFALDEGYIAAILGRGMFHGRRVKDAYRYVVEFDIRGYWGKAKHELGYLNIPLLVNKPFHCRIVSWWGADEWFEERGKTLLNPVGYYWNRNGELRRIVDRKELKNIALNGNEEQGLFVRADFVKDVFEAPYYCKLCGKSFARVEQAVAHIESVHGAVDESGECIDAVGMYAEVVDAVERGLLYEGGLVGGVKLLGIGYGGVLLRIVDGWVDIRNLARLGVRTIFDDASFVLPHDVVIKFVKKYGGVAK